MTPEELLHSLNWRYATKEFDAEKTIPNETWDAIEQSLILTPSSFGLQPWKFITVTDQKIKDELMIHSWNQRQVADCSHMVVLCAKAKVGNDDIDVWLDRLVEIRGVERESLDGYAGMMRGFLANMDERDTIAWAKHQVYIALGQLMASAAVLGIDACPMEGILPAEYDRVLGLQDGGYLTTVGCALGYRSAEDKYAEIPKVRYQRDSVIGSI
ncbi:NAD(P)H-dependent oxidoreductase [Oceaniferula spumae]|uniref:NAD(P)H-dependent oxidoreductase n=1 Tax=Oceaniferula spumae TaxID=2979115 RepID=A0AAT9FJL6_9BACT